MANPSKRDSAARKVVAAARAIVTYQIGLPAGCQRIGKTLFWLGPYEKNLPTIFEEYMKAVIGLPIGRDDWNGTAMHFGSMTRDSKRLTPGIAIEYSPPAGS